MPLNEREQKILEEIERQFYQEDPRFAHTVRNTTLRSVTSRKARWAALSIVVGLVLMLVFFTQNSLVALAGFILMVAGAGWLASSLRRGSGGTKVGSWLERTRQRWRRDR